MKHLENIRLDEISKVAGMLSQGCKILEIGAGSGWQSKRLEELGFKVSAVDIPESSYAGTRVFLVREYDGQHIPFQDREFDVVFSSSVLEHVQDLASLNLEIHRVLKDEGCAIHVLPNSNWRLWTLLTYYIDVVRRGGRLWRWGYLKSSPHGERGNAVTEIYFLSRPYWVSLFRKMGWALKGCYPNRLFYTGYSILDSRLSIKVRRCLSHIFGSVCHIYVLKKAVGFKKERP